MKNWYSTNLLKVLKLKLLILELFISAQKNILKITNEFISWSRTEKSRNKF